MGLAAAYIRGFSWCLEKNYDFIAQMDADFSHQLNDLQTILSHPDRNTIIVGNRWKAFCTANTWSYRRASLSWLANLYTRIFLGKQVNDWTSGFNLWPQKILRSIDLQSVISKGFCFQIEMKYKALQKGFTVKEVGIEFAPRRFGKSKLSPAILFEAFYRIWKIRSL